MSDTLILVVAFILMLAVVVAAVGLWVTLHGRRRPRHFGPSHDTVAADLANRLAEHAHKG